MKTFTIALLLLPAMLLGEEILFEDDFSDGYADGWMPLYAEGTYFVNDGFRYDISYDGENDVDPCVIRGDSSSIYMTVNDYSVLLEGIGHAPSDFIGIFIRGSLSHTGYVMWLRFSSNNVDIFRHDGPGVWSPIASISHDVNLEEYYWLRFECDGDDLRGKVWQGEPGDEPAEWLVTVVDGTWDNYGFAGFVTGKYYSNGSSHAELDNVVVTSLDPGALDQTTWAHIKATLLQ